MVEPTNPVTWRDFLIPAISGITAFGGTMLGAKLALSNFYRQRIWEQRAASYTSIFEAIHSIERWHAKHFEASFGGARELSDERKKALQGEANRAEESLERLLAGGAWLLPAPFRARVQKMIVDLKKAAQTDEWHKFLNSSLEIIFDSLDELLPMARADLIKPPWYRQIHWRRRK
jgi:hypothetical protein